ncbi:SAM-DEPENDENT METHYLTRANSFERASE [Salix purpurea]|uniref:SAM-DEPENDENT METHYLTRANSFERASE n=1 Tax=Salix purpurea TaxID=77065 RepID=A0A9Q0PRS6_SALPP|nr:SAM-DEPENDENT METHYLTRANSFERASE [Salix purpurea]
MEKAKWVGSGSVVEEAEPLPLSSFVLPSDANKLYSGVVRDGEKLDFCMCNPPFFVAMVETGLNPKTSFAGTPEEMVCPGGEKAFITHIIEDSVVLKESSRRWFTSMLRRKTNIKFLTSKLRDVGVTMITASNDQCKTILRNEAKHPDGAATRSPRHPTAQVICNLLQITYLFRISHHYTLEITQFQVPA